MVGLAAATPLPQTDRTRPQLRVLAERQLHRPPGDGGVGEGHQQRHRATVDQAGEARRVQDAAVHRERRDVVLTRDVEPAEAVGHDLLVDVAVAAADVGVGTRVVGDEPGVVTTPRPADLPGRAKGTRGIAVAQQPERQAGQHDPIHYISPYYLPREPLPRHNQLLD